MTERARARMVTAGRRRAAKCPALQSDERSGFAHAAHTVCERLDEAEDTRHEIGLGLAIVVEARLHAIDDGRADDGGIGMTRHGGSLVRCLDAKANTHRQLGMTPDALDMRAYGLLGRRLGAGDTEHGDEIDEA